jgi:hypothetical protein
MRVPIYYQSRSQLTRRILLFEEQTSLKFHCITGYVGMIMQCVIEEVLILINTVVLDLSLVLVKHLYLKCNIILSRNLMACTSYINLSHSYTL